MVSFILTACKTLHQDLDDWNYIQIHEGQCLRRTHLDTGVLCSGLDGVCWPCQMGVEFPSLGTPVAGA